MICTIEGADLRQPGGRPRLRGEAAGKSLSVLCKVPEIKHILSIRKN